MMRSQSDLHESSRWDRKHCWRLRLLLWGWMGFSAGGHWNFLQSLRHLVSHIFWFGSVPGLGFPWSRAVCILHICGFHACVLTSGLGKSSQLYDFSAPRIVWSGVCNRTGAASPAILQKYDSQTVLQSLFTHSPQADSHKQLNKHR